MADRRSAPVKADEWQHLFTCRGCQFTFVAAPGPIRCVRCGHLYVKDHGDLRMIGRSGPSWVMAEIELSNTK